MRRISLFLALLRALVAVADANVDIEQQQQQRYCYKNDPQKYFFFGPKTAYDVGRGDLNSIAVPEKCEAVRFWSLNRHGTRFSVKINSESVAILNEFLAEILNNRNNSQLCQEDLDLLESWKRENHYGVDHEKELSPSGYGELKNIAKRYKEKYSTLLDKEYSDNYFYFQHTDELTTKQSFQGFAEGLFGQNSQATAVESNEVIRQFKLCSKWDSIMQNTDVKDEQKQFKKGPEFQRMLEEVSRRLGFAETVNKTRVSAAYDFCRFEKAWNIERLPPWCSLFTKEQIGVFEYSEDLRYYHKGGYGGPDLNPQMGCLIVKDFYKVFQNAVADLSVPGPKVMAYFTHSAPLMQIYTALNLFHDEIPLTHTNYKQQAYREFRLSRIDTFATNLVAVLYKCEEGEKHRVQFLLSEKPLNFEGCTDGLCPWTAFQKRFSKLANSCNLGVCEVPKEERPTSSSSGNFAGISTLGFVNVAVCLLLIEFYKVFL